jgi:hypothetical protein
MMVIFSQLHRGSTYFAVALLLALLAHLAVMASSLHAGAMVASEPNHHAAGHQPAVPQHCDTCNSPLPDAPTSPKWDACGLEAALPIAHSELHATVAMLPYEERRQLSPPLPSICPAWLPDPPPRADGQALLQVFRL